MGFYYLGLGGRCLVLLGIAALLLFCANGVLQ